MPSSPQPALPRPAIDIAPGTRLIGQVQIESPFKVFPNVTLNQFWGGAFSYVAPGSQLHRVRLGRYCSIGDGVSILSSHPSTALTSSPFPYQSLFPAPFDAAPVLPYANLRDTVIGNDVWIGSGVRIKSGVCIGDGAIIGAASLVTRDVAPFSVVGGVPARVIRARFDPAICERLKQLAWWRFNLVGLDLPWQAPLPDLLDALQARVDSADLAAYTPRTLALWLQGRDIKGRYLEAAL